jgi:DHA2 family multidrug resistance protein
MAKGMDMYTATRQAYAAVFGMVQQQAAMVSFIGAFRLLGIMFLCVIPLILVMKKPRHAGGGTAMH